jgi:hypothetical protein
MITDEVYAYVPGLLNDHGCPWGWVRFIDDTRPQRPNVISEYKLPANEADYCGQVSPDRNSTASFAAHNPTLTEHLAILTWHSYGLQAIDTTNPAAPTGAASFLPAPVPVVQTEDPILSSGRDKVVMWSFPHIVDGLVYVVDLRNGLYVLRYKGPFENEVGRSKFLDGASNSGDFGRINGTAASTPSGSGGGSGGGGSTNRPAGPSTANPAIGGPAPCLAGPVRVKGKRLSRFTLGMKRTDAQLRGGPAKKSTRTALRWCSAQGGDIAVVTRRGKVVFIATTSRKAAGFPRGWRPGSRFRGRRQKGFAFAYRGGRTIIVRTKGKRIRAAAIAQGKLRPIQVDRYLKSAGM